MNNHILLERMDEADIFLLDNLNEQNKFKNPNDVNVEFYYIIWILLVSN